MRLRWADLDREPPKVRDYLLSNEHPVGRLKAVFFKSLGYSVDTREELQRDVRALAQAEEARLGEQTKYARSTRFVVS